MKHYTWKKTAAFVMSLTLVAGMVPANVGGLLTGDTGIVANAEDVENITGADDAAQYVEFVDENGVTQPILMEEVTKITSVRGEYRATAFTN